MSDAPAGSPVEFGDGLVARVAPGDADKILWIHGYTIDSSAWRELWDLLPGWHHVGIDLPGHGASRPFAAGEDLRALARTLGRLAIAHGIRHVAALSFGTIIAMQIAIEFPTAFRTVIVGATSLAGGPQDPDVERLYEALIRTYHARGPGPHLRELWMTSPPPLFAGAEDKPELWARLWRLVGDHRWSELADGAMQRLTATPQREADMRKIAAAALVVLGEQEMPAFRRCGEIIRRAVPDADRRYLPGVGHLCLLEAPAAAAALIDAHLRAHACAAPPAG